MDPWYFVELTRIEPRMGEAQPSLFDPEPSPRPARLGDVEIAYEPTSSILTKATGFMADYDYTLNPYSGCGFGCTYCYAAFFSRTSQERDDWGAWVRVKENVVDKLRNMRSDLRGKTVYMSSVTDPYQLIERRLGLVRALLDVLADRGVRLVVQTRSPLVTRDIDLLHRFEHLRINMTVTTDSEAVRKAFEPRCPPNSARLDAVAALTAADLPTSITMTPLLPVSDPAAFAGALMATGVEDFVVQPFHVDRGKFVAGTRGQALAITEEMGWGEEAYRRTVGVLRAALPNLLEGRQGFRPA